MTNPSDDDHHKPYYPEHPGYVKGSDTSKAAADSVDNEDRLTKQRQLYELLQAHEPNGLTNDEVEVKTGWLQSTVTARSRELEMAGLLYKSDVRRLTRWGRSAVVRRVKQQT